MLDVGDREDVGLVIDCGSSKTQLFVYTWDKRVVNAIEQKLPKSRPLLRAESHEVRPGIAEHDSPTDVISELLDWAKTQLPAHKIAETRVHVLATAGMRLLKPFVRDAKMREIADYVDASEFVLVESAVSSGEEEALQAWVAANDITGQLTAPSSETTGVLEMGGASLQFAFAPPGGSSLMESGAKISLLGVSRRLYAHSYLGYGADEIQRQAYDRLREDNTDIHPCLPLGSFVEHEGDRFRGSSDVDACEHLVQSLFRTNSGREDKCEHVDAYGKRNQCSFHGVYSPDVPTTQKFVATAGFAHWVNDVMPEDNNVTPTSLEIRMRSRDICALNVVDLQKELPRVPAEFRLSRCLIGTYIAQLVPRLKFDSSARQIEYKSEHQGQTLTWTLGAMLMASERLPMQLVTDGLVGSGWRTLSITLLSLLAVLGIVLVILRVRRARKQQLSGQADGQQSDALLSYVDDL